MTRRRPANQPSRDPYARDPYARDSYAPQSRSSRSARGHASKSRLPMSYEDASSLSRERSASRYVRQRKARSRKKLAFRTLTGVGLVLAAALVALVVYVASLQAQLGSGVSPELRQALSPAPLDKPFYMLLLGTDKSAERAQSAEFGADSSNYRTDSMILARIDPATKHVTLVSIERDTLVTIGSYGQQKINAAYSLGGAPLTVETVSKFAGVPISHYAEINFDEFVGIVDKIGGIDVNIKIDLDDDMADLHLKAGEQTINGAQALALCRSRHAYDAYGGGDYYRTANQRMVIGAILKKVLAANPVTMLTSVGDLAGSVTTDFSVVDILRLMMAFRGFNISQDLYSGLEPTNSSYVNGTWYETVNEPAWRTMMERVDQGLSPYSDASQDFTSHVAGGDPTVSEG